MKSDLQDTKEVAKSAEERQANYTYVCFNPKTTFRVTKDQDLTKRGLASLVQSYLITPAKNMEHIFSYAVEYNKVFTPSSSGELERKGSPMSLHDEIQEQPATLQKLISNQAQNIERIAKAIQKRNIRTIFLAARGTSDHAGLYAKYLLGAHNQLPIALAAPSLFSLYHSPPNLEGCLVLGISQSGMSPDINSVLEEGKRQGAMTLAITNSPSSPLATQAEYVIDICAGPENAVAATKSYSAQLLSVAMLSAALNDDKDQRDVIARIPELVEQTLQMNGHIDQSAARFTFMNQCVVLGRGFNYATAFEWSLKMKELSYVVAEPYSSADFQHGPIAIVEHRFPIFAVMPQGVVFQDMLLLLQRLLDQHEVELVVVSNQQEALQLANTPLGIPIEIPEWISPVVSIIPAQLFCYHLTLARGFDPEQPRGLHKVTETH